jgi:hypothetical protein
VAVCVGGIAGMIASSVAASTGGALTFGLLSAVAVLCAMVATAVTSGGRGGGPLVVDEAQAARVEQLVGQLVAQGAEEDKVRALVSQAVRLGRGERDVRDHHRGPEAR